MSTACLEQSNSGCRLVQVPGSNQSGNKLKGMLISFVGELGALEEVVGQLVTRGLLKPMTLKALWFICSTAFDQLTHVSATCMWACQHASTQTDLHIQKEEETRTH